MHCMLLLVCICMLVCMLDVDAELQVVHAPKIGGCSVVGKKVQPRCPYSFLCRSIDSTFVV